MSSVIIVVAAADAAPNNSFIVCMGHGLKFYVTDSGGFVLCKCNAALLSKQFRFKDCFYEALCSLDQNK